MLAYMNVALREPSMTREEFFDWAEVRRERYEFDGFQPVAMNGGTFNHSLIARNILTSLHNLLRGTGCTTLGSDAGVNTVGDAVRYPDVLVTCSRTDGKARTVNGPVIVFEVVSPSSGRLDRIDKLREYQAVETIRRTVIVEQDSVAMTVYSRDRGETWEAVALTENDVLSLPEIDIELAVAGLYEGVEPAADA